MSKDGWIAVGAVLWYTLLLPAIMWLIYWAII